MKDHTKSVILYNVQKQNLKSLAIYAICGIINQQFIENEKGLELNEYKDRKTENNNELKLEFTIEAKKFDDAIMKVFNKSARYFNIPGFRKEKHHLILLKECMEMRYFMRMLSMNQFQQFTKRNRRQ